MIYNIHTWLRLSVKVFRGAANRHEMHQFEMILDWLRQGRPHRFTPSWRIEVSHKSRGYIGSETE